MLRKETAFFKLNVNQNTNWNETMWCRT